MIKSWSVHSDLMCRGKEPHSTRTPPPVAYSFSCGSKARQTFETVLTGEILQSSHASTGSHDARTRTSWSVHGGKTFTDLISLHKAYDDGSHDSLIGKGVPDWCTRSPVLSEGMSSRRKRLTRHRARDVSKWDKNVAISAANRWKAELERKSHLAVAPAPVTIDGSVPFAPDAPATFTLDGPVLDPAGAPLVKEGARSDALSPTIRIEDFWLRSCIGIGAFATVHRAIRNSDGLQVAVKISRDPVCSTLNAAASGEQSFTDDVAADLFCSEVKMLTSLNTSPHPNILGFFGFGLINAQTGVGGFLVTSLAEGYDLRRRLKMESFTVKQVHILVCQLARALLHLHNRQIAHRDVKSSNIMVAQNNHLVLLDFGLAYQIIENKYDDKRSMRVGCEGFMAPETYREKPCELSVDVFSFGQVLHRLLCRAKPLSIPVRAQATLHRVPWDLFPSAATYEWVYCRTFSHPKWPKVHADLVRTCCKLEQSSRPSMESVSRQLEEYTHHES